MSTAIDTLATYEAIAAAGVGDSGARAISKAIADAVSVYREDLATKADLAELRTASKTDLMNVENTLKGDIAGVKIQVAALRELIATTQNKTLIWMFGMLVTFSGIIIGFIKLT
ncbi:MAG: hypothetical protein ACRYG4_08900 [Janthinobacterium lividum]